MIRKEKFQPLVAEYLGTILLSLAVLTANYMFSIGTAPWYVSLTAGGALALIIMGIGHVSGAHVNPAVTLGLWTRKQLPFITALLYIATQVIAGASALLAFNYFTGRELPVAGSEFLWRAFFAEMFGAALFGAGIMIAFTKKLNDWSAATMIGASLTAGAMTASLASSGFLNPAVALANNSFNRVTLVAPLIGMVLGMHVYVWLLAPVEKQSRKKK
jgi:aquaporin Z